MNHDPTWTEPCDTGQLETQPTTVDLDMIRQLTATQLRDMTTVDTEGEWL